VDNITFKDDLDEATITQWIKDKRPSGAPKTGGGSAPKDAPSFGSKRFGKKSDDE
jgi:hypothetical protein